MNKANTEEFIGEWLKAQETCIQAEKIARSHHYVKRLPPILHKIGWILRSLGDINNALAVS